jgi:integrase
MAIIRLFLDSGMRRAELAMLKVDDVDFDHNVALIMGKGRRPRAAPFGRKTAIALTVISENDLGIPFRTWMISGLDSAAPSQTQGCETS